MRVRITLHDRNGEQIGGARLRIGTDEQIRAAAEALLRGQRLTTRRDVAGWPSTKAVSYQITPDEPRAMITATEGGTTMTTGYQCECDEQYGPCEQHGQTIAQREGSSHRTADELALVYCSDVADIIGSREQSALADERARLCEALRASTDPTSGCAWFADPADADAAQDLVMTYEYLASDAGFRTYWDDGYRIVRVTGGPLA